MSFPFNSIALGIIPSSFVLGSGEVECLIYYYFVDITCCHKKNPMELDLTEVPTVEVVGTWENPYTPKMSSSLVELTISCSLYIIRHILLFLIYSKEGEPAIRHAWTFSNIRI